MDERSVELPEDLAMQAELIASKKGLTLEQYVDLLLRREVCDTSEDAKAN